jgi:hypothetical protein
MFYILLLKIKHEIFRTILKKNQKIAIMNTFSLKFQFKKEEILLL